MSKVIPFCTIFLFLILGIKDAQANPKANIRWEVTSIDLGEIEFKKPVTAEFIFENLGLIPFIINDVKSSCGCTVPDYPKQPVTSGHLGKIVVTFDAETEGHFSKSITVYSNAEDGVVQLYIYGMVIR